MSKPRFVFAAALAGASLFAADALATTPISSLTSGKRQEGLTPGAEKAVDLHNGSFQHRIDIEVPEFHGLEPDLDLAFNSSGGNGFVGVGWALEGFSVIERVSSSLHGTRRCTPDDMYTLDGEPLLPCNALGGTHCTKKQGFERIRFDAGADRWFIWEKNGTKLTYDKIFQVPYGQFEKSCPYRYGLVAAEDTHGNRVDYSWFDDSGGGDVHKEVYPAQIAYNGTTITFDRERVRIRSRMRTASTGATSATACATSRCA